jgi:hypothetical protein
MPSLVGISYTIMSDSGVSEGIDTQGMYAIVVYKIPWAQRFAFYNAVVGTAFSFGGVIGRTPPMVYTPNSNLYAMPDVQTAGHGKPKVDSTGFLAYDYALVTVRYARPPWAYDNSDPSGQPWTTTSLDIGGQFFTVPDSVYHFGSPTGPKTTLPVGIREPQVEIQYTRHWAPYLPVAAILSLVGKVNVNALTVGDFTCAPQTVLFNGGKTLREADTAGNAVQRIDYRHTYKPSGWNKQYNPASGSFDTIVDNNGNSPYAVGDFSTLP